VVHCLLAHGISSITVSEPSKLRGEHAKSAGAQQVVDPTMVDLLEFSKEVGDGRGFQAVFDCAGVQAAFDSALQCVRGKGKIINVAVFETQLVIKTPNLINRRQISYIGSNTYTRGEFQEVIEAIASGEVPVRVIRSSTLTLRN
jgi:(R,R)-butanediol dehydrogenase / meso-butanediol dehydrogenase / diacetyl reductase